MVDWETGSEVDWESPATIFGDRTSEGISMPLFLEECPLTAQLHRFRRERIAASYPELATCADGCYLALWKYMSEIPERFYCRKSCDDMLAVLRSLLHDEPRVLTVVLREYRDEIGVGLRSLHQINEYSFHDEELPTNEYEEMLFLDRHILPSYVKLIEGAYANLILCFAVRERLRRGKKLEGLDVYNRVEAIRGSPHEHLTIAYDNTIRNAVAHGGVLFRQDTVGFSDRKSQDTETAREMVSRFDRMVDVCNGLALGLTRFLLENKANLGNRGLGLPMPLLIEELKAQIAAPGWSIATCLESQVMGGERQLTIFVRNGCFDSRKVQYHAVRTAILAERFAPGYARYFLRLDCMYSWKRAVGWAGFIGPELARVRERGDGEESPAEYGKAIEEDGIVFFAMVKVPAVFSKISTLCTAIRMGFNVSWAELREQTEGLRSEVRKVRLHRNGLHSVVNGSIVIHRRDDGSPEDAIRAECRRLVKKAARAARKRAGFLSVARRLPVGFVKLSVYDRDLRMRELGVSGLIPELVATIEFKRLKRIRTIDIFGGEPEVVSGCRIVWNRQGRSSPDSAGPLC